MGKILAKLTHNPDNQIYNFWTNRRIIGIKEGNQCQSTMFFCIFYKCSTKNRSKYYYYDSSVGVQKNQTVSIAYHRWIEKL